MGLNMIELEIFQNEKVVDDIFKFPTNQESKNLEFSSSRYDFSNLLDLLVALFEPVSYFDDFLHSFLGL